MRAGVTGDVSPVLPPPEADHPAREYSGTRPALLAGEAHLPRERPQPSPSGPGMAESVRPQSRSLGALEGSARVSHPLSAYSLNSDRQAPARHSKLLYSAACLTTAL